MAFNSIEYVIFLPLVYLVYYFTADRIRWFALLAASLLFYSATNAPYLFAVIALVAIVSYSFGIWLDQAANPKRKLYLLWGGIALNCAVLVVMKYLTFLALNLSVLAGYFSDDVSIRPVEALVAVGVSYYVFQAISYLCDIYLGLEKPERHFGYFTLYLAFFPKLMQGPIERCGHLLPQLKAKYEFNYDNMRSGLLLFTWGLFKKVVVADRLAIFVNSVYDDVYSYNGFPLLLATCFYALQIYCDFSGYTDMALGTARLFNIKLTQNFNRPYLATSVADFWRRWHISFSSWILDYIFKPLQMQWRNWKNLGTAAALMVTFFVSGLWHGASWCFVIWGVIHGIYLACSVFYRPYKKRIHKALGLDKTRLLKVGQIVTTFAMVCFAWIFFRANSTSDAWYVVTNLFSGYLDFIRNLDDIEVLRKNLMLKSGIGKLELLQALLAVGIVFIAETNLVSRIMARFYEWNIALRWSYYFSIVLVILLFGVFDNKLFLYNRF